MREPWGEQGRRNKILTSCCRAVVGYAKDLVETPICSRCGKELITVDLEAFISEEVERDHAARRASKERMKIEKKT